MSEACFFPQSQVSKALSSSLHVTARSAYKSQLDSTGSISRHRNTHNVWLSSPLDSSGPTLCTVAGAWQGQRARAVEKALLGSALDVDALIQALEALPQDLHPTPTPGSLPWPTCITLSVQGKHIQQADFCSTAKPHAFALFCYHAKSWLMH